MSEALELVVESAWLQLAELAPPTARTLYLTPFAEITRFMRPGSIEIGTFTRDPSGRLPQRSVRHL
jgi:hypothetical protein